MTSLNERLNKQIEDVNQRIEDEKNKQHVEDIKLALDYAEELIVLFQEAIDDFLRPVESQTKEEFSSYVKQTEEIRSHRSIWVEGPDEPETIFNVEFFREKVRDRLEQAFGEVYCSFHGQECWTLEW